MQIDITGHHVDVTDTLRARLHKTLSRIDQRADSSVRRVHVVLGVDKKVQHCDIQMNIGGSVFVAKDESTDMYIAIDRAVEKIKRQIEKVKGKQLTPRRDGEAKSDPSADV